jgi:cobalamin biosynthesis protein CobT
MGTEEPEAVLAPAIEFLLRERLTGRPLPEAANRVADVWREQVAEKTGDALDKLISQLHDQPGFARTVRDMIRDLTATDVPSEDAETSEDQQDSEMESEQQPDQGEQEMQSEEEMGASTEADGSRRHRRNGRRGDQCLCRCRMSTWRPTTRRMTMTMAPSRCARISAMAMTGTASQYGFTTCE